MSSQPGQIARRLLVWWQARLLWPTGPGWVLLTAAVASFLMALIVPLPTIGWFAALIWGLLLVSALLTMLTLGPLTVTREPVSDAVAGQALTLPLRLRNDRRWPCAGLLVLEECPLVAGGVLVHAVPRLAGGEELRLPRPLVARRRGEFTWRTVRVRAGDAAGLFFRQRCFDLPVTLLVYPDPLPVPRLPLRQRDRVIASPVGQAIGASGMGQEFFGVREYRPTDGMRVIHWKASAKQRRLMVREFEETSINQVTILLDTGADGLRGAHEGANLEYLIRLAAGILRHLAGLYCRVLLQVGAGPAGQRLLGDAQMVAAEGLAMLARLRPGDSRLAAQVDEVFTLVPPHSVVYILSLREPTGEPPVLRLWRQQGIHPRWLVAPASAFAHDPDSAPLMADALPDSRGGSLASGRPHLLTPASNPAHLLAHD